MNNLRICMEDEYSIVALAKADGASSLYFVPNKYSYGAGLYSWSEPATHVRYARNLLEDFFRSEEPEDWKEFTQIKVISFDNRDNEMNQDTVTFDVEPEFFDKICISNPSDYDSVDESYWDFVDAFSYQPTTLFD